MQPNWKKSYNINMLIMTVCKEIIIGVQETMSKIAYFKGEEIYKSAHQKIKVILRQYYSVFEQSILQSLENIVNTYPPIPLNDEKTWKAAIQIPQTDYAVNLLKPGFIFNESRRQGSKLVLQVINWMLVKGVGDFHYKEKIQEWIINIQQMIQFFATIFTDLNLAILQNYVNKELYFFDRIILK